MFLDFAQDQAKRRKQVFLKDWKRKLDLFFDFNERKASPRQWPRQQRDSETTAASVSISSLKTAAEQAPCCGSS